MLGVSPPARQRLAFGRAAKQYDRARPSYPAAAVDAVLEFAQLRPPATILEVGAGTGKATTALAARGFRVTALEPSSEMAAVARANCAGYPGVEMLEIEFERWHPREGFAAVVCASAWHWLSETRYDLAAAAVLPGGTLAALWTFPDWTRCPARSELSDAYRAAAPNLRPEFPMHPDSRPDRLAGDWRAEIESSAAFGNPARKTYRWRQLYTSSQYALLLQTHQDHILLARRQRERLLAAVTDTIDAAGGVMTMSYETRVCLATRG